MGSCWKVDIDQLSTLKQRAYSFKQIYELQQTVLGKGSFGEVRRALSKKKYFKSRAAKIIWKNKLKFLDIKAVYEQAKILSKLDHPNIVKIYDIYEDMKCLYVVTQLLSDTLYQRYNDQLPLSQKKSAKIMKQVLSALFCCQKKGITHLDIKLQNIMYQDRSQQSIIKVVDFGLSKYKSSTKQSIGGTLPYIAPEIYNGQYDPRSDIWSAGVMLYLLIVGQFPFSGSTVSTYSKATSNKKFNISIEDTPISNEAKSLLRGMLNPEYKQRYQASDCLTSAWLSRFFLATPSNLKKQILDRLVISEDLQIISLVLKNSMVNRFIDKKAKQQIYDAFKQIDFNQDGILSQAELINVFKPRYEDSEERIIKFMKNKPTFPLENTLTFSQFQLYTVDMRNIATEQNIQKMVNQVESIQAPLNFNKLRIAYETDQAIDTQIWNTLLKEPDMGNKTIEVQKIRLLLSQYKQTRHSPRKSTISHNIIQQ